MLITWMFRKSLRKLLQIQTKTIHTVTNHKTHLFRMRHRKTTHCVIHPTRTPLHNYDRPLSSYRSNSFAPPTMSVSICDSNNSRAKSDTKNTPIFAHRRCRSAPHIVRCRPNGHLHSFICTIVEIFACVLVFFHFCCVVTKIP